MFTPTKGIGVDARVVPRRAPSSCTMLQLMAYSMLALATTAPKVKLVAYEEAL